MARPEFIVERLRELMEGYHNLSGSKKISIPVAFTFSKVDTLRSIVAPDSAFSSTARTMVSLTSPTYNR